MEIAIWYNTSVENTLSVIPLGGVEEIGLNMTVLEYNHHILIIDAGLMFPEIRNWAFVVDLNGETSVNGSSPEYEAFVMGALNREN